MSLRNLDVAILNGEGAEMKEAVNGVERVSTVRFAVRGALAVGPMIYDGQRGGMVPDHNVSPEDKLKMYELAMKLKDTAPVDLKAEDILLIKRCVKHTMPFVYGQICEALEKDIPPVA